VSTWRFWRPFFAFDPKRKADLRRLDALISKAAPSLERYLL
jgi:hypothetical protein